MTATPRPWLVVTDDGRRPWHKMFRVRDLGGGERIAYWWGQYRDDGMDTRAHAYTDRVEGAVERAVERAMKKRLPTYWLGLRRIRHSLWAPDAWFGTVPGASPHPGRCSKVGYIGIAMLPDPPDCWRPDAVWPGWRHLAHDGDAHMALLWEYLESATDEALRQVALTGWTGWRTA